MHPPLDAEEGCLSHTLFYILLACERTQREGSRGRGVGGAGWMHWQGGCTFYLLHVSTFLLAVERERKTDKKTSPAPSE